MPFDAFIMQIVILILMEEKHYTFGLASIISSDISNNSKEFILLHLSRWFKGSSSNGPLCLQNFNTLVVQINLIMCHKFNFFQHNNLEAVGVMHRDRKTA